MLFIFLNIVFLNKIFSIVGNNWEIWNDYGCGDI